MYVIGSYLICVALILLLGVAAFAVAVAAIVVKEIAKFLAHNLGAALHQAVGLLRRLMPKAPLGWWPHQHPQHSH